MALLLDSLLLVFIFLACPAVDALLQVSPAAPGSITDHLALMSFKAHIKSDPLQGLASWGNQSIPMCQWHGVACGLRGRRHGRVVSLDLTELNLLGTITPALGNLTYLRRLYLPWNRFHGILPQELGNLPDLETLQLKFNSIQGQLPPSLSNCSHLVEISLNGNKLQGGIPSEFTSLHNLEFLILAENRLTGRIPSNIGNLVNLKKLTLLFNNMTGEIPASMGNLSALTFLNIAANNLKGSIPPLQGLTSLNILELAHNKLEGTIPSWLGNLSSLVTLDLQFNGLVGQIPESLGNLELLTGLSLSENRLSGSIPDALGSLHALTGLYLSDNELEGYLPPSIFNASSLEMFNIQHNNLTGVFPANLGSRLSNLKHFLVSDNQFHGMLPSSLCNASMLQMIQTVTNFLSGRIPQCLGTHQKDLSVMYLEGNQFEATNDADWGFLTSLTNCSNMQVLDVSFNKLQGVLPNSIGNLSTRFKYLSIGDNNITGTITEGIGNLMNLTYLDMGNNHLKGNIPSSLGKLKLDLLSLSYNALSGPIPVTLGNLTKLIKLSLSTNMVSGAIPSSLSNCPLEALDLSYNNLSGPIPKELLFVSTLSSIMYLSHNSLSGTLPSEVGNLKNLDDLDFSNNRISGEIPTTIGECQSLEYLNISNNIIEGTIPLSIGNLRGLLQLDLSYNNLCGTIPEVLGSLTGLYSLNLSFNKFQGEVPTDGVFLNATTVLIIGNDGLCGGIPQLKLPPCSNHTTKKPHPKLVMIGSLCSACVFVTLVFALSAFYQKSHKTKVNIQRSEVSEQYMRVSYAGLANATNGFASENLIGAGSFGSVYKGRMRGSGQHEVIAVKVINLMQHGASQSFVAECKTLRCARHRNLVRILTVCSSIDFEGRDFKALVYEFLPNGNLDQRLHQHIMEDGERKVIDLIARLGIAIDVASSLDYLHQYKPVPIIHCDLKPSNVLLDSDMVAHVGDFGLARFLHQDMEKSNSWVSMRGTIGYAAPGVLLLATLFPRIAGFNPNIRISLFFTYFEYGLGNEASTHGDVYSYGILLLEMFTGKRPTDSEFREAMGLREYVQLALPDRVGIIVDRQLLTETEDDGEASNSNSSSIRDMRIACITSILQVGVSCSEETPTDRAPIGDALKELQAIRNKFEKHLRSQGASSSR